jgi:hypothetical protein
MSRDLGGTTAVAERERASGPVARPTDPQIHLHHLARQARIYVR